MPNTMYQHCRDCGDVLGTNDLCKTCNEHEKAEDWPPTPGSRFSLGTVLTTREKEPRVVVVLVLKYDGSMFITGKVTPESAKFNEWSDGHYFELKDFEKAYTDYLKR